MKNVTITLPPEVARWAKSRAAHQGTSVSRMVGEMLREQMVADEGYERSMEAYLTRPPVPLKGPQASCPARDVVHDRSGLR